MDKNEIKLIVEQLSEEMQEEDIGINLFTRHYREEAELKFFKDSDRVRVEAILERLTDDSYRHKEILKKIVKYLEAKCHE